MGKKRLSFPGVLVVRIGIVLLPRVTLTMVSSVVNCPVPMNLSRRPMKSGFADHLAKMRSVQQIMLQLPAAALVNTTIAHGAGAKENQPTQA